MSDMNKTPNRLIHEKSPYLLQHAYNPVDWYPWGEDAFTKARQDNKPIFLSIGYSTCHWCHVMERESFEDEHVARLLNEHFVPIKVDREERPDVDHVYIKACQAMTGQGGWPLTVVVTPDGKPFFAGTYFPKSARYGLPGIVDILTKLAEQWENNHEAVVQASHKIVEALKPHYGNTRGELPEVTTMEETIEALRESFDSEYGGFGEAPKFPTPHNLMFLMRYAALHNNRGVFDMVATTLNAMQKGGIYDHLGGGFARYSTDEQWLVPHFEKMLYDNALLAYVYTEAFQLSGDVHYKETVRMTLKYLTGSMRDEGGAFYAAEDADSEGEEGRFYVWTKDDVLAILGPEDGEAFCDAYDVTEEGNFDGVNVLNQRNVRMDDILEKYGLDVTAWEELQVRAKSKLYLSREEREHPHRDDKVLTAWNGLAVAAFAKAGAVFKCDEYVTVAREALSFIRTRMTDESGRLLARYRDNEAGILAYTDDYAYLSFGVIELYKTTGDVSLLKYAVDLQTQLDDLFWDHENGGYFLSGVDAEQLVARPKDLYDGATPSGNAMQLHNLLALARLTGAKKYQERAEELFASYAGDVREQPVAYTFYVAALALHMAQGAELVIVDEEGRADNLLAELHETFAPTLRVVVKTPENAVELAEVAPWTEHHAAKDGSTTFYLCRNFTCNAPETDWTKVVDVLKQEMGSQM